MTGVENLGRGGMAVRARAPYPRDPIPLARSPGEAEEMNGRPATDTAGGPRTGITVRPASVAWVLGSIAGLLVLASLTGQLIVHLTVHDYVFGLPALFDINRENNIPTAYAAFLLVLAAQVLTVISIVERGQLRPYWIVLSAGFFYMALDEMNAMHEEWIEPVRGLIGGEEFGIFYFTWVVPGLLVVLVLGVIFSRFLLRLPARTRRFMVLAGSLFVGGALGIEMIGGWYAENYSRETLGYDLLATVEESLEMAGVIVFIWTLLDHLSATHGELRLGFGRPPPGKDA